MSTLSHKQKAVLSQLAARAWRRSAQFIGYASAEEFRHAAVAIATHGAAGGLRDARQEHYTPIYNYMAPMAGVPSKEDHTPRTPRARALFRLEDALARFELPRAYAMRIIERRLAIEKNALPWAQLLDHLTDEEILQVSYTIATRGRAITRRLNETHAITHQTTP